MELHPAAGYGTGALSAFQKGRPWLLMRFTFQWISDEKAMFRKQEKETIRTLIGMLIFESIMIIISIALQQRYEELKYLLIRSWVLSLWAVLRQGSLP